MQNIPDGVKCYGKKRKKKVVEIVIKSFVIFVIRKTL